MACGCSKPKNLPNAEAKAAERQALAESRVQALARFRQERQQRIMAQQRKVTNEMAR
jgi:hypothetical protein